MEGPTVIWQTDHDNNTKTDKGCEGVREVVSFNEMLPRLIDNRPTSAGRHAADVTDICEGKRPFIEMASF